MKTKTFTYWDQLGTDFHFTVKEEFLELCPKPHLMTMNALNFTYHLSSYLHSIDGPAAYSITNQRCSYWIDGQKFSGEAEWAKAAQKKKFENKIDNLINDD